MRVVVSGPESSGGRFVSRWLDDHPDLAVSHWSMPHGSLELRHWPTDHDFIGFAPDVLIVMTRDWCPMIESQIENHRVTKAEAEANVIMATARLLGWGLARGVRTRLLSYEAVLHSPRTMPDLFDFLNVAPIDAMEEIVDANFQRGYEWGSGDVDD